MSTLVWGTGDASRYESGVDHGVIYPMSGPAVVWNGLVSVDETSASIDPEPLYFNGIKYLDLETSDSFKAAVASLTVPPELEKTLGIASVVKGFYLTGQGRSRFHFSYRSNVGQNGYKTHLVYNALATPQGRTVTTLSDSTNVETLSYALETIPVSGVAPIIGPAAFFRPSAHFVVDSTKAPANRMAELEAYLYGTDTQDPLFPTSRQLTDIFKTGWVGPQR